MFILLNACIGLSSAPFYDTETSCNLYQPSNQCLILETNTDILYCFELAFSIIVVVNGCLVISLADNLRMNCLRRVTSIYSKVGLFAYPVLFITRIALFIDVVKRLKRVNQEDYLTLYGMMFAVYAHSQIVQIIVTTIVIIAYIVCYVFLIKIVQNCN